MDKLKIQYIINMLLALSFLLVMVTGVLKFMPMNGIKIDLPWRTITQIHDWSGMVMGLLAIIHIATHWRWIIVMTARFFRRREPSEPSQ
jgi:hypothetical protein